MRVLVLTIEEEPPGLRCYPNNLQRTSQPFSSLFEEFYKKCLQKNPRYIIIVVYILLLCVCMYVCIFYILINFIHLPLCTIKDTFTLVLSIMY